MPICTSALVPRVAKVLFNQANMWFQWGGFLWSCLSSPDTFAAAKAREGTMRGGWVAETVIGWGEETGEEKGRGWVGKCQLSDCF